MKRFPIFFAADDNISGAGVAVPVIPPPSAQPVIEVNLAPDTRRVDAAAELGIDTGIRGPADIFGEDEAPEKVTERIEAGTKRERGPDGKFAKKEDAAKEPAKEAANPTPKPVAKVTAPAKVEPPTKIKIGDEEKTAEEWAAYHKELSDKAAKVEQPAKVEEVKGEPEPEDIAAQQKQVRDDWEKKTRETYAKFKPTQEQVDKALASGNPDELYEMFTLKPMLAMEENIRLWVQNSVNPLLDDFGQQLNPLATSQQQMAQYQAENQFLDENPEIKAAVTADPARLAVHRQVNEELRQEMDYLSKYTADNPANAVAKNRLDALTKDFLGEMAKETKARYAATGVATAPPAPVPAPKKTMPAERPLSGDRPGAAAALKTESREARLAREVNEHQGV